RASARAEEALLAGGARVPAGATVRVVEEHVGARAPAVGAPVRAGTDTVLARLPAGAGDATAATVVVVVQEVGTGLPIAAGLVGKFGALAAAGLVAIHSVAAPTGVVADSRPVPAGRAGVAALNSGGPRRPGVTRLRGGSTQQRPRRQQDRDQPRDTRSYHGSLLSVVWSQQDGAAASSDVVTLLRYPSRRSVAL